MLGRKDHLDALDGFANDPAPRVCVLSGRGGIGKSKILHDWTSARGDDVLFLKDEPLLV